MELPIFVIIIGIIISLLPIILFFKVWGMCNNTREILRLLQARAQVETHPATMATSTQEADDKFYVGQLVVVLKDESQFRIDEIKELNGKSMYHSPKHNIYFYQSEIADFEQYWEKKRS